MSAQVIGYLGENGVRDVRIPIGHLLEKWQGLRPSLVMVPVGGSDDEAYPVQYTMDGTDLVWHVSDEDTAVAGTTKAAVRMVDDGGRVGMDEPFQVIISPNLSAGGEPPVVIKPWVDRLTTLVPRAEAAAERAENAAQNWENGTASNSNKLGGKPQEYYLPAVQLMGNPDFAIAQAGYGGNHGTLEYACDRWRRTGTAVIEKTDSGMRVSADPTSTRDYEAIWQKINDLSGYIGKSYTLAACINGNVSVNSGKIDASGKMNFMAGSGYISVSQDSSYVQFNIPKGETHCFSWVALYEGSYTADTLPPFVPRPYAVELAECRRRFRNFKIKEGNKTFAIGFARSTTQLVFTMNLDGLDVSSLPLGVPSFTQNGYLKIVGNDKTIKGVTAVLDSFIDGVAKLNISTEGLTAGYSYLVLSDLDDADSTITELAFSSDP